MSAVPEGVGAVCFDAFGTLVEIADRRRPYAALARAVRGTRLARRLLTEDIDPDDLCRMPGVTPALAARFMSDLAAETASVAMRPGMAAAWHDLRRQGVRIGVCSNLAAPYGPPLLACLPEPPDACVLSYAVGHAKPEPAIYGVVCDRLGLPPDRILFVGDTPSADVDGPRAYGMRAVHVADFEAPHLTVGKAFNGTP